MSTGLLTRERPTRAAVAGGPRSSSSCSSSCRSSSSRAAPPGSGGSSTRRAARAPRSRCRSQEGWGVPKIGDELHKAGVIGSSLVFSVYARLNGDTKFEAGTYELKKHMGVRDAVKSLKAGPRIDYVKLTIPPGLWLKEIAQRVGKMPGEQADAFLQASQNNAVRSTVRARRGQQPRGSAVARHLQDLGRRRRDPGAARRWRSTFDKHADRSSASPTPTSTATAPTTSSRSRR